MIGRERQGLELELARFALYVREARRSARKLGVKAPGLNGGMAGVLFGAAIVESVLRVAGDVQSVPAIRLEERELPERVPFRELLEATADEFRA